VSAGGRGAAPDPGAGAGVRRQSPDPARTTGSTEGLAWLSRAELPVTIPASAPEPVPLLLERIGDCLLASDGSTASEGPAGVARLLPPEADRLAVVLAGPAAPMVSELAHRLQRWVQRGWESVRLIGSGAAAAHGGPSPGQELADRLGVEVVAPDGRLLAVPDG